MSPKLPVFTPEELIRLLESRGFSRIGQRGSHVKMRDENKVTLIVPVHSGRNLKVGLVLAILRQAGIEPADFRENS